MVQYTISSFLSFFVKYMVDPKLCTLMTCFVRSWQPRMSAKCRIWQPQNLLFKSLHFFQQITPNIKPSVDIQGFNIWLEVGGTAIRGGYFVVNPVTADNLFCPVS